MNELLALIRSRFDPLPKVFSRETYLPQAIRSLKYDAAKCIRGSKSQDTYYGETDRWTLKSFLEA